MSSGSIQELWETIPMVTWRRHAVCFPDTVVTCVDADPRSKNYEALRENIRRLRDATTEYGKPLATIDLRCQLRFISKAGGFPPVCELLHRDGVVLVPCHDPNDRVALDIFADKSSRSQIVGIYCGDLIWGFARSIA